LARITREPVSAAELAKAVKQFTVGTLSSRKTMEGQAQDLGGNWIAAQDLRFSERYLAAVRAVTPDDLIRVARTYLRDDNRTVFALLPKARCAQGIRKPSGRHPTDPQDDPVQRAEGSGQGRPPLALRGTESRCSRRLARRNPGQFRDHLDAVAVVHQGHPHPFGRRHRPSRSKASAAASKPTAATTPLA
jgi:hypothetical protein